MRRLALLLLAIFLSACQSATPIAGPTTAPTSKPPPAQPTLTRAAITTVPVVKQSPIPGAGPIAVENLNQQKQPNGDIHTTGSLVTSENLGVGQIEVASPESMKLGDTRTIRLRLSPATQLANLTPQPVPPGKTPDLPNVVYRFGGNLQLYPVMYAELRAITFAFDVTGPQQRRLEAGKPIEWTWLVRAQASGRQDLALEISIPAIVSGVASEISTNVLQNITLSIQVDAANPPTPTPTPTPPANSFWDLMGKSIAENAGAILIALIGLVGTLIGILVKARSDAKADKGERT